MEGRLRLKVKTSLIFVTIPENALLTVVLIVLIFELAVLFMLSHAFETVLRTEEKALEKAVLIPSSFPPVWLFIA